jgi:hypothetical protein
LGNETTKKSRYPCIVSDLRIAVFGIQNSDLLVVVPEDSSHDDDGDHDGGDYEDIVADAVAAVVAVENILGSMDGYDNDAIFGRDFFLLHPVAGSCERASIHRVGRCIHRSKMIYSTMKTQT